MGIKRITIVLLLVFVMLFVGQVSCQIDDETNSGRPSGSDPSGSGNTTGVNIGGVKTLGSIKLRDLLDNGKLKSGALSA